MFVVFLIATLPLWVLWIALHSKRKEYNRSVETPPNPLLLDSKAEDWWLGNPKLQAKVITIQVVWAVTVVGVFFLISSKIDALTTVLYCVAAFPIWIWASVYLKKLHHHYRNTGERQKLLEYSDAVDGWWFGNGKLQLKCIGTQIGWILVVITAANLIDTAT